jgi:hypothetical protein
MADNPQVLSNIASALAQHFRDPVQRTVNRRSVLLRVLRIIKGEGKNVAWPVEFDGAIAEGFADGAKAENFGSDGVRDAILAWGTARSNFRVGDIAAAAAASSRSPEGLANLLGRNFMNSVMAVTSDMNKKLYAGGSNVVGLVDAVADDNTYAGIDRTNSDYAGFRANVADSSGSPITLAAIRQDITVTIYNACGMSPDIAMCPAEVFQKIGTLFQEFRRENRSVTEMTTGKGQVKLDGSIGAIEFEGCVFIKDKDCTADTIYYLNSENVEVEYLPQVTGGMLASPEMDASADDGGGQLPLGMKLKKLAVNGASSDMTLQAIVQLAVRNPKTCGKRVNIG